jgi:coatomer protein complex subunit epsilon
MEHDSLRQVRNSFYLGLWHQCLQDAQDVMSSPESSAELQLHANIFYHRALCFIDPAQVISRVSDNAHTGLQVVKLFAQFLSDVEQREVVTDTLQGWKADEMTGSDVTLTLVLASCYLMQRKYKEALQLLVNDAESVEKLSLTVLVFLLMDRHDLAGKQLKILSDLDDDDVLTQLATAWTLITHPSLDSSHQAKVLEAESILQGLQETFPSSQPVLTALSVCEMQKSSWTDAFKLLRQGREMAGEDGLMGEVLVDSIVSVQHMHRGAGGEEVMTAIRAELQRHQGQLVQDWGELQKRREADFDRQAANYKWKE